MDFGPVFRVSPNAYLVLRSDYTIVATNESYLRLLGRTAEALIGQSILDAFPADPQGRGEQGVAKFRAAVNQVVEIRQQVAIPAFHYPIAEYSGEKITFDQRVWNCMLTPIIEPGTELFILLATHEVAMSHFSHWNGETSG